MDDFNLVLQELIKRDLDKIDTSAFSEDLKKDFESTAERFIQNGNLLNALKVYALTKNKDKLIETSELCLKENQPYEAFQGFLYANEPEHLNKIGFILLKIPDVEASLKAFRNAKNDEMVNFIELNLL